MTIDVIARVSKIMAQFEGWDMNDVFGACLCGLCVAARRLGLTKLDVQKLFVEHWDRTAK